MPERRVVIIAGPTASGKSALALRLAESGNGVIINADSMQVYQGLSILTAGPTQEEMCRVPHRLFFYLDPAHACSVGQWMESARLAIYETWQEGKLPIVVGGTGMYLKCLMEGISSIPDIDTELRETLRKSCEQLGTAAMYEQLQTRDPEMASRLKPGDTQRILRALEVLHQTGISLAEWQQKPRLRPLPDAIFWPYSLQIPREKLYERCNLRLETMLKMGAMAELKLLLGRKLSPELPAMRAVGVPELSSYLRGEATLPEALEKAQQTTRNYAKRQMTWLRNQLSQASPIAYPYDILPVSLMQLLHAKPANSA